MPLGYASLVRTEQYKHVSTKSRTHAIHFGWQSIKEGNVMFLDGVDKITFAEDGVFSMTYSANGKRLTRCLYLRNRDVLKRVMGSIEAELGSLHHVRRRLSKWEGARSPLLAVTGLFIITFVIGLVLMVCAPLDWSLSEISVGGIIMLVAGVITVVYFIRERGDIDEWEPAAD